MKRKLFVLLGIVVGFHFMLVVTNHTYLYTVIRMTVFKGKLGPSIDEYDAFVNDTVPAAPTPDNWPLSRDYNSRQLPASYMEHHDRLGSVAYLIIRNDSIVHEQYWEDYGPDSYSNSFSMAKSIVSVLAGIAIQEGKIKGVDQPVCDFFPAYCSGLAAQMTVRDLLTMSSGINFDEDYLNPLAYPAKANYGRDLRELNEHYTVTQEPGQVFSYQSGTTQLLAFVVEEATGKPVAEYAAEKLWKPLGARNQALWSLDHADGSAKAFCCFNSNARDFARIGSLYLHHGNWKGTQLVDSTYVAESVQPASWLVETNDTENQRYGYQWWTFLDYNGLYLYYMRGILGQYVFVLPEKDLVVVRLGHKREKTGEYSLPADVYYWLDAAIELYAP